MGYNEAICNFLSVYNQKDIELLFDKAVQEVTDINRRLKKYGCDTIGFMNGLLCKYVYSCVIDADRYDTATYKTNEKMKPPEDYTEL